MKPLITVLMSVVLVPAAYTSGYSAHPSLTNGAISYTSNDGRRKNIEIGKRCDDLWVAPDESIIAFIAIDKAFPGTDSGPNPFIVESSLYIARKTERFRPARVNLKEIVVDGKPWKIVRYPSVSPDLSKVYFSVPYTMKDWKLMSVSLPDGANIAISDEVTYCIVWGGHYSGDLLLLRNVYEPTNEGLFCFRRDGAGAQIRIDDPDCIGFAGFAARWSRERGGACTEGASDLRSLGSKNLEHMLP